MQTFNHLYSTNDVLESFVLQHDFSDKSLLVQIFSGALDVDQLKKITQHILKLCPQAQIIGATTSGGICDGQVCSDGIVLSFSSFEQTQVLTHYYAQADVDSGILAGQFALEQAVKCVIAFGDVFNGVPHLFLQAFSEQAPSVMLAGGSAGDQDRFEKTYLIHSDQIYDRGIVLAFLINPSLVCHNDYFLNWLPVGKAMKVTRCKDNIVYELDNQPVIDVHKHYLGDDVGENLPSSILAFPLLKNADLVPIARVALGLTNDGGLLYGGDFIEGELVKFGIPEHHDSERKAQNLAAKLDGQQDIESLFVYSCTARRSFLGQDIEVELSVFQQLADIAGFFTYGEYFYLNKCNQTLNITSTILALSEQLGDDKRERYVPEYHKNSSPSVLKSLVNLINVTATELDSNMSLLQQYREVIDQASIVSKTDPKGNITYVNEHFEKVSGYSREEVIGKSHNIIRHPDMPKQFFKDMWRTITDKKVWQGVIQNRRKDGLSYSVKSVIAPILDEKGEIIEYIGIRTDISELLKTQAMIERQFVDKLTGLANRNALLSHIEEDTLTLLGLLDIRNFKAFNDFYGVEFADRILVEFASWLSSFANDHQLTVYRVFGNRFALIKQDIAGVKDLTMDSKQLQGFKFILRKLWTVLDQEIFIINDNRLELDVFIGVGVGDHHLLSLAESAVNQAKEFSHQRQIVVCDHQTDHHKEHLHWVNEIRDALDDSRIVNFYQPIVSLNAKQENKKYEALVRLIMKDGRVVTPFEFLYISKKTRYYQQITKRVFDQSLAVAKNYGFDISINLSIEDILNHELGAHILLSLAEHNGGQITLEITESESIKDYALVKAFIDNVHLLGAKVAIDDFGSGYSNFSYLVEMKADYLKIDGSIIKHILTDNNSRLVTESIIDIARKLKIAVVAEFVSDEKIATALARMGIDFAQGYYYGKPEKLSDIL